MVACRRRCRRAIARRQSGACCSARSAVVHKSCVRQVHPAAFSNVSAPETALARPRRSLPRGAFAEDDPAFAQIVWRHLDVYAVSNDRSNTVTAHFSGCVGDDAMLVVEGDAEASIGQDLVDRTLHRYELFLRQTMSAAYKKSIRAGVFRRRTKWREREEEPQMRLTRLR